jgi:flagellar biosynthetic protein FlhB
MFILEHWAWMTIPILAVAIVTGIVVSAAQVGLYLTWEPIEPNWERINPISGMQRFFSMKNIVEGIKAVLKLTVVSLIVYFFIKSQAEKTLPLLSLPVHESLIVTLQSVMKLFFILTGSLLVLGALDYGYQRYELESRMKMTKREAKDEFKLREGDPLIKSRIRSIQRKMASKRMMEAVPKADVVITNPTHFAVALQYNEKEMAAPKVIAKGADIVAQKIKEVAKFHRIPCVENRPLARTLFKNVEINQYVPRDLYKAVAEVLAYVYRLRGRIANG